jgi:two-component system, chemotaxis family, protein-glutamate methylesterase/glutaminase
VNGLAKRDIVVVGASAGGVEALRLLVAGLPADLPAAVFVVLHMPRSAPSALPAILNRPGPLTATAAVDGEKPVHGRIYVAGADHHLLIIDGRIRLSRGPSENGHRPAIDPLFRSAARAYGPRVIGVVLSGSRDDGAAGLESIVGHGGVAVVQEPADALHPSMPNSALERVNAEHVVPAAKMGALIGALASTQIDEPGHHESELLAAEVAMAGEVPISSDDLGVPAAGYGCPSCGDSLYEMQSVPRFRCRVGHAWSPDSLLDEQGAALESGLWVALRTLEEKKALCVRLATSGVGRGHTRMVQRYESMAEEAEVAAGLIRDLIARMGSATGAVETHSEA